MKINNRSSLFDVQAPVARVGKPAYAVPAPPVGSRTGISAPPIPSWLLRRLEAAGAIDSSGPGPSATRRARTVFCPGCHRPVMRGLLSMPTPWPVDADPTPLTPDGEALALLAGVGTYELAWRGDRYELDRRDVWRLHHRPARTLKFVDLLAEHRCGTVAPWPRTGTALADPRPVAVLPQDPPF